MRSITFSFLLAMSLALGGHAADDFIHVGNLRVHYTVSGKGPAMVFLHAGYQDLHMWAPQEAWFSKEYKVVLIDMPGHGLTTGIDTNLLVKDVIRTVMDSLGIQKAVVVGLSMGGACATDFALDCPGRVSKLILVAPGLSGWRLVMKLDTLSRELFNRMDSISTSGNHELFAAGFVSVWCVGPYRKPAEVDAHAQKYVYETTLRNHTPDNGWPVYDTNYAAPRVKEIRCPVLVIRGDKDIPFIIQVTDYFKQQLPGATLVIFPNVAHMVNMEKPDEFNRTVQRWLKGQG